MARLHLLAAASALALLCQSSVASAEPTATAEAPGAIGPQGDATPLPGSILRVLNALQAVGVAEIDRSSTLITKNGVADTARFPVHDPIWVSPEPPTMPLFFGRVMKLKF